MVRPIIVITVLGAFVLAGCGSEYTIVNRSAVKPSPSSVIAARGLIGESPAIADHLAQAYEVYTAQLTLLKQRRNKVRARKRTLAGTAIGALAAGATTAAIVGAYGDGAQDERLQQATGDRHLDDVRRPRPHLHRRRTGGPHHPRHEVAPVAEGF